MSTSTQKVAPIWLIYNNTKRVMDGVVVTTSTWHAGCPGSIPGHSKLGIFGVKTWLSTLGALYPSCIGESC